MNEDLLLNISAALFQLTKMLAVKLQKCPKSNIKSVVRFVHYILKGSYNVAKKNIILCIWCNAMCLHGLRFKKHIFSTYRTLLLLISETFF